MPGFDVAEFKRALSAAKETRRGYSQFLREAAISEGSQRLKNRQAVAQVLKPFLTKAGLDVAKLDEVLAQNQNALRSNFEQQKGAAAKYSSSRAEAFRYAMQLANRPLAASAGFGGLSSLITLSEPFLVWEWNPLGQLKASVIQPLNSYAKILVDIAAYSGLIGDSGSDSNEFSFFFFWTNDTGSVSVVKVFSVLALNGACEVAANSGFLSGDSMNITLDAWLYPITTWLPIPQGGDLRSLRLQGDPNQHQQALDLTATGAGGNLFGGKADYEPWNFSTTPYGLSFASNGGVLIPPAATAVFEVNLTIGYKWNGSTLPDEIKADFADDNLHYYVGCPLVVLEFLTAPPAMG